jgi:hypothetical protein
MDWGIVIQVCLGILGAALIVGGIVAYRGSPRTGVRAFAAAGVAAGVVMWAFVLVTIPVSHTSGDWSPDPQITYQSR